MKEHVKKFMDFRLNEEDSQEKEGIFAVILNEGEPKIHEIFDNFSDARSEYRDLIVNSHWDEIREIKTNLERDSDHIYPDWDEAIDEFMEWEAPDVEEVIMRKIDPLDVLDQNLLLGFVSDAVRSNDAFRLKRFFEILSKNDVPEELTRKLERVQKVRNIFGK